MHHLIAQLIPGVGEGTGADWTRSLTGRSATSVTGNVVVGSAKKVAESRVSAIPGAGRQEDQEG